MTETTADGGFRRERVVRLGPGDVAEAVAIDGVSPSTSRLLARDVAADDHLWLGVRDPAGDLVAVAGVVDVAGDAHLVDVAVCPDHRRAGLATRLVTTLLALARDELGSTAATLEVRASNVAAQALYRRLGFESAGLRRGYYPHQEDRGGQGAVAPGVAPRRAEDVRREDAMVMWRHGLGDL